MMTQHQPKPFVFVLMPFDQDFNDVYNVGIKPACDEAGAYAERVDEQDFKGPIMQRIYNQISKADIIISDITDSNPNVFYETGYSHALGKYVLMVTQDIKRTPFDLKDYSTLAYDRQNIHKLKIELTNKLSKIIATPAAKQMLPEDYLRFVINGQAIIDKALVEYKASDFIQKQSIDLKIAINNPVEKTIRKTSIQIALITTDYFAKGEAQVGNREPLQLNTVRLPEKRLIHIVEDTIEILPGGWRTVNVRFFSEERYLWDGAQKIILRTFSTKGPKDEIFSLKLVHHAKT